MDINPNSLEYLFFIAVCLLTVKTLIVYTESDSFRQRRREKQKARLKKKKDKQEALLAYSGGSKTK